MARYTGPSCRLCRREGMKLFLKGNRCSAEKCTFIKRQYVPGQHGKSKRMKKLSNYGEQLREKQKTKRIYGILEKQFRRYFKIAEKSKEVTGKMLLQILERRLDNVTFQLHFATSRTSARQLLNHGFIYVNQKRVNVPSYLIKADDEIEIRGNEKVLKRIKENIELSKERDVPKWIKLDAENLKGKIIKIPSRDDVQLPIREQLIVELYSK